MKSLPITALTLAWLLSPSLSAQPFLLPTANRALFEPGGEDRFFVGTPGKSWTSGTFGCVRSEGQKLHEGIDIKCRQRDKQGEPSDPVMAAAEGTVIYLNRKSALSNYGNYLVLQHRIEGMEIYSLYAHLRQIRADLKVGQLVKAGETVAIMGRTANTRSGISKDRAHLHFELNLFVNDRFAAWYKGAFPKQRNDHGAWNGQNLVGLDPRLVLLAQHSQAAHFSLLHFVRDQTELCRVLVRKTQFPWLKRYPMLIRPNSLAQKEGVAGYELALNYNGLPFEAVPRAASEIKNPAPFQLLSVKGPEQQRNPCRHLVTHRGAKWALTQTGIRWLELLTY